MNGPDNKKQIHPILSLLIMLVISLAAGAGLAWTARDTEITVYADGDEPKAEDGEEQAAPDDKAAYESTEKADEEVVAADDGNEEPTEALPDSVQEVNGMILEYSSSEKGYCLKSKDGQPYHEGWFASVEAVNSKYFYISGKDGVKQLFDSSSLMFIDLSKYAAVSTVMLHKDGRILDNKGVLVTEDGKAWKLITEDEQHPVDVKVVGEAEVGKALLEWVDLTYETPTYTGLG